MSHFSVNNFSRLNNDFNQQSTELPASVDKTAGEKPAPTAGTLLKNNPAVGSDGTVTLNKDALEKLFEMFEYAFKTIRNMLSGQGGMPRLIPDAGPQPKPEREGDALVKDKTGSQATVLNTALKDKAGTQSEVLKTVLKDKAGTNPEVSTQKDTPANNPAVPNSTLTVTPKPQTLTEFRFREPTLHKDVQVNNRSNSDVNVTVQVMNCHCPHPDAPNPRAPVPPKPNAPKVLVSPKPDAPVSPNPDAPVPPTPGALVPPSPDAPILPTPDTPTSDVTSPGPAKDDFLLETTGRRRVYDNDWRSHPGRRMSR